jgi:hypothetical protein
MSRLTATAVRLGDLNEAADFLFRQVFSNAAEWRTSEAIGLNAVSRSEWPWAAMAQSFLGKTIAEVKQSGTDLEKQRLDWLERRMHVSATKDLNLVVAHFPGNGGTHHVAMMIEGEYIVKGFGTDGSVTRWKPVEMPAFARSRFRQNEEAVRAVDMGYFRLHEDQISEGMERLRERSLQGMLNASITAYSTAHTIACAVRNGQMSIDEAVSELDKLRSFYSCQLDPLPAVETHDDQVSSPVLRVA